jgi:hypothetical protein
MATLRNIAISLLHHAGITEITQTITKDRNQVERPATMRCSSQMTLPIPWSARVLSTSHRVAGWADLLPGSRRCLWSKEGL